MTDDKKTYIPIPETYAFDDLRSDARTKMHESSSKRHDERGAEDYLRVLLKSAQYIDNVAHVLETAGTAMKEGETYKEAKQKVLQYPNRDDILSSVEKATIKTADRGLSAAHRLKTGLEAAEMLATGSAGKLASVEPITRMQGAAEEAQQALQHITSVLPHPDNGLTDDLQVRAKMNLKVMNGKLLGVLNAGDRMADALAKYNESYLDRMADAQSHKNAYEIPIVTRAERRKRTDADGNVTPAVTPGVRREGYKQRQQAILDQTWQSGRVREEARTGTASFREAVETSREAPEPEGAVRT